MTSATERLRERIAFVEDRMHHTYDLRYVRADLDIDIAILASLDTLTAERDAAVKRAVEAEARFASLREDGDGR